MPQRLMTPSQAARALGVSNVTVRSWARAGRLTDHGVTAPGHVRHHGAFLSSEVHTLRATRATNVQGGTRDAGPRRVRVVAPEDRLVRIERMLTRICRDFNLPTD